MHPGFAELVAGLSDVMHTAYQCLERAFEVSGFKFPKADAQRRNLRVGFRPNSDSQPNGRWFEFSRANHTLQPPQLYSDKLFAGGFLLRQKHSLATDQVHRDDGAELNIGD